MDLDYMGSVGTASLQVRAVVVVGVAGVVFVLVALPGQESLQRVGVAPPLSQGRVMAG
jgi:hypothetical protein